jgi:RNA polymerase sigma-70 factor (ECF subfamily)
MRANPDELIPTRWTLIKRLKDLDDNEAWRGFFDTYWRLIHGTALKAGLTEAEAQDVVQETVISLSRKIGQFNPEPEAGSFKSWLLQMTRWRIVDQIRKRLPAKPSVPGPANPTETSTTNRVPDPGGLDLEKIWDEEWRENLIAAALERVQRQTSAKHYQLFYLYVIRELPVDQVARVTGATPNEVYIVKHRVQPLFEKALLAVETNKL